jgi:hypothetical protein
MHGLPYMGRFRALKDFIRLIVVKFCSKANNNKTKTAKDNLQPITILDGLHEMQARNFVCQNSPKNDVDDVR